MAKWVWTELERLVDGAGVIHMDLQARTHSLSHTQEPGSMTKDQQGSSRDVDLLEPPDLPQGSPASSSVWRADSGLLCRPCRKRRPSVWDLSSLTRGRTTAYCHSVLRALLSLLVAWCSGCGS